MHPFLASLAAPLAALALATPAAAATPAEDQALAVLKRAIAFRSVAGAGNQAPALADYLQQVLVAGGFAPGDVVVTRLGDTAYLAATLRGADRAAKPLLLSGHIDVVEAKPADWTRDPFTPVIENGYIYGRGATDMKFDVALMVATLIDLKKQHFVPHRDVVLILSGDEETTMATTRALAQRYSDAALLLNGDGGGGRLEESGKPAFFNLEGAEKAYADFVLTITNPGGHSSAPRRDNAIVSLARAVTRIGAYRFTPQLNDTTRAFFVAAADREPPALAAAMRAFAADPTDQAAIATLADKPEYVGQIGTTCVPTMIAGGHAENALPQRASANVNCRIFPGTGFAAVQATLAKVIDDPAIAITFDDSVTTTSPASPMRADVTAAMKAALAQSYPGVPIIPSMAAGASDNMWFRNKGVPSYGVAPIFLKASDDFSHGLNERTPIANIAPGIAMWTVLVRQLSR